jgi:proteasome lid subunit RPN8/RPN11
MTILEPKVSEQILEDALKAYPDEGCGFLFGVEKDNKRFLYEIQIVHNAKEGDKRRRFSISPIDYLKAEQYAEEQGIQLLGIYHSHPNHPAIPSEHDRVAAQPYFSYLIISILENGDSDLRSWRLNDEQQFEEEQVNEFQLSI